MSAEMPSTFKPPRRRSLAAFAALGALLAAPAPAVLVLGPAATAGAANVTAPESSGAVAAGGVASVPATSTPASATTTPTSAVTTPTSAVTTPSATVTATKTTTTTPLFTPTQPAPASAPHPTTPAGAHSDSKLSTPAIVAAVLAALIALGCAAWGIARMSAYEPRWTLSLRHAMAEAGFRASATWAELTDWARLGR